MALPAGEWLQDDIPPEVAVDDKYAEAARVQAQRRGIQVVAEAAIEITDDMEPAAPALHPAGQNVFTAPHPGDHMQELAVGIVQSLKGFVPKVNGRVFSTPAEMNAWRRMPGWQKAGLIVMDESFQAMPTPLKVAVEKELRGAVARAAALGVHFE